jgi:hypothetical protein
MRYACVPENGKDSAMSEDFSDEKLNYKKQ